MINEPNLKDWAEALIHGITGSDSYNPKLVKWVEAELTDIAKKHYDIGLNQGWAIEQDKALSKKKSSINDIYLSEWEE